MPTAFIARQPIFNHKLEAVGYELLFRGRGYAAEAPTANPERATATVVLNSLTELELKRIVGTKTAHPGQLPPYNSIYSDWSANKPDWMPPFVSLVRGQLDRARAIKNHVFGLQQFVIAKPIWESYLKGEESDPKVAMQKAMGAVAAEVKKG